MSAEPHVCPLCSGAGHIPPDPYPVPLTGVQKRIYDAVTHAPDGLRRERLIFAVWGDDPSGGPSYASQCLSVHLNKMNKRLAAAGLRIKGALGRDGKPYRLTRIGA